MSRQWGVATAAIALVTLLANEASAQLGMNSSGSLGSGLSSSGSSAGRSSSSGTFGSRTLGAGSTRRGNSFSNTGPTGPTALDLTGGLSNAASGTGFDRNTRQVGSFVGTDSGDLGRFIGTLAAASGGTGQTGQGNLRGQGRNQRGGALTNRQGGLGQQGFNNQQDFNQQSRNGNQGQGFGGQRSRTPLRTSVVIGFDVPVRKPSATGVTPSERVVQKALARINVADSNVALDGRTAILRGTVATVQQRDLAEQMLLLQPGVDLVQNELVVTPPADSSKSNR